MGAIGRRNLAGLALVVAAGMTLAAYRAFYIEPRSWGALCAAAAPPLACVPRGALLWLQREELWGSAALVCGLAAFLARGPFWLVLVAIILGIAGVENYNATWGMAGAALGAWTWLRIPPSVPASSP